MRGGLLSVARPLPADFNTWRQGINFNQECGGDVGYSLCIPVPSPPDTLEDVAVEKTIGTVGPVVEFAPFMLYRGSECSTWFDTDELLRMARDGYVRGASKAFARQLQVDASGSGNPSLNGNAVDITPGGGAVDVVNTISGLIASICDCGMNDLVLHMHLRAIPFLMERDLIKWDMDAGHWRHGPWPVVFDCFDPVGPGAVAEPIDGSEIWMYATGPIEIAAGPEVRAPHDSYTRTNEQIELVERMGMLRFDTCCVQAALGRLY